MMLQEHNAGQEVISLEDLFKREEIQNIQDNFALATGVASIITHPDGMPFTAPSNFTRLCSEIIRKTEKGCANCLHSDAAIGRYNTDGPTVQQCLSGGLWDAGASITVGGRHVANWLIGQVRDETQTDETMRAYAHSIGTDEHDFMDAFNAVPTMSRTRFEQIAAALYTFARQLSTSAYQNIQQARLIAEHKATEEALREGERRFRAMFEQAAVGVAQVDTSTGRFVRINKKYCDLLGYTQEEMMNIDFMRITHPSTLESDREKLRRIRAGEVKELSWEKQYICKNGATKWMNLTVSAMWTPGPTRDHTITIVQDITDHKLAEDAIRLNEEKFRKAFVTSPDAININRMSDGMYIQINNGFTQIMGYTEGDVIGKSSIELNIWDDLQDRQKLVEGLMKEGSYKNLEAKFRGKDGKIVHRMMSSSVIQLNGIDHILSITRDITERKQADENLRRMEDRLRQSQKMDAIGQLASGVAHDFNNVLGGIIGYTELSLAYVEKKSVVEKNLQRILQASDRATHLVKQILTFSRQGNPQKLVISIRPILKEVLELLRASIPSSVVIEDDLQKNVKSVLADPTKIHEAVLNLATNAVHAMNRKGVLTIRLFAEILDHPEYGWIGELAPGEYTVIEVADTGCGMDAATLSKAFDPFFTTKPVGEGTGMGLSVVHGVVQSNGGDISIESTVGKGTTIRIYLPVTEELIAQKGDTDTHAGPMGHERILFVDDEQMLIDMNKELLTGQGYTVTCRKHSGEALSYIRENAGEIDILVTDQTMPGMTGIELAKEALTIRHDLPIILCTGFSSDVSADHATTLGIKRVVMKPYRSHTLCDSIREVLDAHA